VYQDGQKMHAMSHWRSLVMASLGSRIVCADRKAQLTSQRLGSFADVGCRVSLTEQLHTAVDTALAGNEGVTARAAPQTCHH